MWCFLFLFVWCVLFYILPWIFCSCHIVGPPTWISVHPLFLNQWCWKGKRLKMEICFFAVDLCSSFAVSQDCMHICSACVVLLCPTGLITIVLDLILSSCPCWVKVWCCVLCDGLGLGQIGHCVLRHRSTFSHDQMTAWWTVSCSGKPQTIVSPLDRWVVAFTDLILCVVHEVLDLELCVLHDVLDTILCVIHNELYLIICVIHDVLDPVLSVRHSIIRDVLGQILFDIHDVLDLMLCVTHDVLDLMLCVMQDVLNKILCVIHKVLDLMLCVLHGLSVIYVWCVRSGALCDMCTIWCFVSCRCSVWCFVSYIMSSILRFVPHMC